MNPKLNETFIKGTLKQTEQSQNEYTNPEVDISRANTKISLNALERCEVQVFEFNELLMAKQDDVAEEVHLGNLTEDEAEQLLDSYSLYLKNEILN